MPRGSVSGVVMYVSFDITGRFSNFVGRLSLPR